MTMDLYNNTTWTYVTQQNVVAVADIKRFYIYFNQYQILELNHNDIYFETYFSLKVDNNQATIEHFL